MEVLVALVITAVVMAMAFSMLGSGLRIARQAEQTVGSNQAARDAMAMVLRDLRVTGVPGGIWVTDASGAPFRIQPIFTQPGAGGVDELWMVVPRPNAFQANCTSPGSGAVVTEPGTGALTVNCTTPFLATDVLMVTNFSTAALISAPNFPSAQTITYREQGVAGFSNAPDRGGFQKGDVVFPVDIIRYSVRPNAISGRPELVRSIGTLNSPLSMTAPFVVPAAAPERTVADVEDLQVAFGTGMPPALVFNSTHLIPFSAATAPLAVRISVVGVSAKTIIDDNGNILPFGPVAVEDHLPAAAIDGFRRSAYRRRVELMNMSAVSL